MPAVVNNRYECVEAWSMLEFTSVLQVCCHTLRSVEEAHLSRRRPPCKQNPELSFTTGPRHLFLYCRHFLLPGKATQRAEVTARNPRAAVRPFWCCPTDLQIKY